MNMIRKCSSGFLVEETTQFIFLALFDYFTYTNIFRESVKNEVFIQFFLKMLLRLRV